jgi:signal transduction histidine kinase/CheY-like chemotaxis protein/HPt (histidine-containing phosphotransfer) domain-containing protein
MLRFSSAQYERRFADHYVSVYFRYAQASLLVGLLLVFGDFLVDYLAHPDIRANFLRLELCVPVLGTGLAYSLTPDARKRWQPAMSGFIVVVAYTLFWILLRIDGEGGTGLKTWVGILNFTFLEFYCFVILGVQFRYALASGFLILVAFEAAMCAHAGLSKAQVAYWSYHVVTLFILSAGIGWWREYLLRREFSAHTALEDARLSAERLARMKGDFLATMSHEIRTPMNGVLGMNELLVDSELEGQQRIWAEGVQASGKHLLGVINDILDFSKFESGQTKLESVDFSLVQVVEEALAMLAQPAATKGLELAVRFTPQDAPFALRGDPFRLRQVIANLVGNAIKFTAEGEVIVQVELRRLAGSEAAVSMCVVDTGIGITPEAQHKIFDPFAQADSSTTREYGGSGLGLAICKRLLELMGGNIRVVSTPGQGSKFIVELSLPLAQDMAPQPLANPQFEDVRVLVVDDNRTNLEILRQQLHGWGMDVSCAATGRDALQLMRQAGRAGRPFKLALLDVHMPQMDGMELARLIRTLPGADTTGLVMLGSTYADKEQSAPIDLRIVKYLSKPVRRSELFHIVNGMLAPDPLASMPAPSRPDMPAQFEGRRVLLVEDSSINQYIAAEILRKLGLEVSLAANGTEAVDLVRKNSYDIVLMDCHMPQMDGFAATRHIRDWESIAAERPPLVIVALTANAMAGDREACIAAGMSDYLPKPITGAELADMMARHLPAPTIPVLDWPSQTELVIPPKRGALPAPRPVFNATTLESLPMVADGSNPGFAKQVLEQFCQVGDDMLAAFELATRAGDDKTQLSCVHTLKSSSAQVGLEALSAVAQDLECILRGGDAPDAGAVRRLHDEGRRALKAIAVHIGREIRTQEISG